MKKPLLHLICCFLTVYAFGQQAAWNGTAASWAYSFADGTGGTLSGSGITDVSTVDTRSFLPSPLSGDVFIRTGSTAEPEFTIDGITDALQFRASTITENTNLAKFGFRGIEGTTAITSVNFTISFSNADAEWVLALGKSNAGSGTFSTTSSYTASGGATLRDASFTAFRWGKGGESKLEFLEGTTGTELAAYSAATPYKLEFLCNNSAIDQHYTKNGTQYTIPSRHLHFWMNDVQVEYSTGVYDFPANALDTGDEINSLMIQGKNPSSTGGSSDIITISGLNLQSVSATTLPVSLTSFTGKALNNSVLLNWQTASESNNSHFDILRFSDENLDPVKIGEVSGKGNSSSVVNYNFSDKRPQTGVNYYQLRQVDFDGKAALSPIVSVKISFDASRFYIYPAAGQNYNASLYVDQAAEASFTLLNINGAVLNQFNTRLERGNNSVSLNKLPLNPGIYLGKVLFKDQKLVKKFIVK